MYNMSASRYSSCASGIRTACDAGTANPGSGSSLLAGCVACSGTLEYSEQGAAVCLVSSKRSN